MASKLKVAIVAPANSIGGQAAQGAFLIQHWRQDPEFDVKLVASDPRFPNAIGLFEYTPYLRTVLRLLIYVVTIWREFAGCDIVHIFSASYWSFLLVPLPAFLVARARKSKVILHYHSGEAADHLTHWRSARWLLRRVDRIVVPSAYLARIFESQGFNSTIVPNGIDDARFVFRERGILRPYLVCTRALEPYYRIDLVIRAFAQVKKTVPQATLTVVGAGSQEPFLRDLIGELALTDVTFAGTVPNCDIGQFYDRADVWVNASVIDNMPVSILEAFSAGCVVVSSRSGGIPFMVKDGVTGLLSDTGDSGALAGNILRVLETPGLGERLCQSAFRQSAQYRWEWLRQSWRTLYCDMQGPRVNELHKCSAETFAAK